MLKPTKSDGICVPLSPRLTVTLVGVCAKAGHSKKDGTRIATNVHCANEKLRPMNYGVGKAAQSFMRNFRNVARGMRDSMD